jgi:16S rRNA (adenine1518-N6/adenine1519-N6)-dimethyltransferase
VERDRRAIPALQEIAEARPGQLEIVESDALTVDERQVLAARAAQLPAPVVANLPFNAGTALLVKWLTCEWPPWWSSLTLMFQKEVAERVCAKPGESAYGRLAVLSQWRTTARILFAVSRHAFVPPPNVTAAVVRIDPLAEPRYPAEVGTLERVTAAAFGQRRKMLRTSLKSLTPNVTELLASADVPGDARAEQLDIAQFCALARAYRQLR